MNENVDQNMGTLAPQGSLFSLGLDKKVKKKRKPSYQPMQDLMNQDQPQGNLGQMAMGRPGLGTMGSNNYGG